MVSRSHLRLLAIPVFAGAALIATSGSANASELTNLLAPEGTAAATANSVTVDAGKYSEAGLKSTIVVAEAQQAEVQAATKEAVLRACTGADALQSAKYFVDGKQVSNLQGNVDQGSVVKVDFTLKADCQDTMVGLAAYKAPTNSWDANTADKQVLADQASKTFKAGESGSFTVTVSDCNFQVDFFTGEVLSTITKDKNYSNPDGRLIEWDNGGTAECVTPPPPPPAEECPADEADRISGISYTINGVDGFKDLSTVEAGDTVKVTFTVDENCEEQLYSLVSYKATQDTYSKDSANLQVLFDADSAKFGPGTHSMEVVVPDCYFQIDFVRGEVIEKFGPSNSNNYYNDQGRLINASIGGDECAVPPVTPPPVTPPVVTPPEVQNEIVTPPPVTPPAVLAHTGSDTMDMLMLGGSLLLMGGALNRAASRARRNSVAA